MRVESVTIKGFRLFEEATVSLDELTTIIVGRNNSGKTSFVELFYKFFRVEKVDRFTIDDLSRQQRKLLEEAGNAWTQARKYDEEGNQNVAIVEENRAIGKLPRIMLEVEFSYNDSEPLTPLAELILDLDLKRHDALLSCRYHIARPREFLKEFHASRYDNILDFTRRRMHYFSREFFAIDKNDRDNRRLLDPKSVKNALACDFIYAQTLFDDTALDSGHGLSRGFEKYYRTIANGEDVLNQLEDAIQKVSNQLDVEYEALFQSVFTDLKEFGVEGMSPLQGVKVKSFFRPESLVNNSTKVVYKDESGYFLSEAHNGLGYTKLIYIVLQLVSFFEEYNARQPISGTHLLFVEEPEAHLHPQMQSVFIRSVTEYIKSKNWNAQLVITTHSSHIIAESGFKGIRYFDMSRGVLRIKDLTNFRGDLTRRDKTSTLQFLEQYMELRRCDMFFADKIILIEGVTERLLLPRMIELSAPSLAHEYISIIEVGGAYAIKFRELLQFLDVPTLIITDIDSGKSTGKHEKCPTTISDAVTTNMTLKNWLPKINYVTDLLNMSDSKKLDPCGNIRVSYQIPEAGNTRAGRSFEEAFILANAKKFAEQASNLVSSKVFRNCGSEYYGETDIESKSYEIAERIDSKSDFAFDILLMEGWGTPKYIEEGLRWLASQTR